MITDQYDLMKLIVIAIQPCKTFKNKYIQL